MMMLVLILTIVSSEMTQCTCLDLLIKITLITKLVFISWGAILSANVEGSPSNMPEFNLFLIACPFSLVIYLFESISVICLKL